MKKKYIIMSEGDNCATSLDNLTEGEEISLNGKNFKIAQDIEIGHKFSLKEIKKGDFVKKYGQIIGLATEDIKKGDWIHTHNIKSKYLEDAEK
jgi:hypothetical protein